MNNSFLNKKIFYIIIGLLSIPIIMVIALAFFYNDGISSAFSLSGFRELFTHLRIGEVLKITERALIVCFISTAIAFTFSYLLITYTPDLFQFLFYVAITLPFLVNESVRIFSWQYFLAENGVLNNFLSLIVRHHVVIFNGSNSFNIYLLMIITSIPFGIFICSASLKTIPKIYWSVADDLNLTQFNRVVKVAIPLSKFALIASLIVIFFIAFSLSSEVDYLGGDTKISTRNLVLSLMSASKFQTIFSLGFFILFSLFTVALFIKYFNRGKVKTAK
jgi:ABC-type spermidine/putrescine transport system permease subunit I